MKFTPGPWFVESGAVYAMTGSVPIAKMDREPGNGTLPVERDNNARLIAAAPELLEQLKNLVDCAKLIAERWESGDLADAVRSLQTDVKFAEAVIAKAENR